MSLTLDLVTLRVVVAVADSGSISAGSARIQLALAAASARIAALEDELGFRLFERSSRGVRVTPAGHLLVQRARGLLSEADRLGKDLRDLGAGLLGSVRLMANASAMLEFLPQRLAAFSRAYPLIRLDLEEKSSPEIVASLLDGRADLGIVDLPHPLQGLHFEPLFFDSLVLVVSRDHPLAGRVSVELGELAEEAFIGLPDGTAVATRLAAAAAELGFALRMRIRMRSFDAACRMIAAHLGVGVLPRQAIAPQLRVLPLTAIAITGPWAARTHHLVCREGVSLPGAAQSLQAALLAS